MDGLACRQAATRVCQLPKRPGRSKILAHQAVASSRTQSPVAGLAQFFPEASPVRIPVRVVGLKQGIALSEETVIEFGTPQEALFASTLPLEFEDHVKLENSDGSRSEER